MRRDAGSIVFALRGNGGRGGALPLKWHPVARGVFDAYLAAGMAQIPPKPDPLGIGTALQVEADRVSRDEDRQIAARRAEAAEAVAAGKPVRESQRPARGFAAARELTGSSAAGSWRALVCNGWDEIDGFLVVVELRTGSRA